MAMGVGLFWGWVPAKDIGLAGTDGVMAPPCGCWGAGANDAGFWGPGVGVMAPPMPGLDTIWGPMGIPGIGMGAAGPDIGAGLGI